MPVFVLSSREDHIVPWRSAYRTLAHPRHRPDFRARRERPHRRRHQSAVGEAPQPLGFRFLSADPILGSRKRRDPGQLVAALVAVARATRGGKRKAPAKAGNSKYRPIEPAPGRYVKHRIH